MGPELDLHRMTVAEALPKIDDFLHDIYSSGLHYALIVHGKGTGVLKQEVGRYLSTHPLVKAYHGADRWSGGYGATEVELINK
jgi:DNA-nicking Smr family endonuclease